MIKIYPKVRSFLALGQPLLELHQSLVPVGDPVLAAKCQYKDRSCVLVPVGEDQYVSYLGLLVHLCICFAFIFKNRVPSCHVIYVRI